MSYEPNLPKIIEKETKSSTYSSSVEKVIEKDKKRDDPKVIMIAGRGNQGKTVTSFGLAKEFANRYGNSLLIECDQSANIESMTKKEMYNCLYDVINGKIDYNLSKLIYPVGNVDIITGGHNDSSYDSSNMIGQVGELLKKIIHDSNNKYETIIIDAPGGSEELAGYLSLLADKVIVVTDGNHSTREKDYGVIKKVTIPQMESILEKMLEDGSREEVALNATKSITSYKMYLENKSEKNVKLNYNNSVIYIKYLEEKYTNMANKVKIDFDESIEYLKLKFLNSILKDSDDEKKRKLEVFNKELAKFEYNNKNNQNLKKEIDSKSYIEYLYLKIEKNQILNVDKLDYIEFLDKLKEKANKYNLNETDSNFNSELSKQTTIKIGEKIVGFKIGADESKDYFEFINKTNNKYVSEFLNKRLQSILLGTIFSKIENENSETFNNMSKDIQTKYNLLKESIEAIKILKSKYTDNTIEDILKGKIKESRFNFFNKEEDKSQELERILESKISKLSTIDKNTEKLNINNFKEILIWTYEQHKLFKENKTKDSNNFEDILEQDISLENVLSANSKELPVINKNYLNFVMDGLLKRYAQSNKKLFSNKNIIDNLYEFGFSKEFIWNAFGAKIMRESGYEKADKKIRKNNVTSNYGYEIQLDNIFEFFNKYNKKIKNVKTLLDMSKCDFILFSAKYYTGKGGKEQRASNYFMESERRFIEDYESINETSNKNYGQSLQFAGCIPQLDSINILSEESLIDMINPINNRKDFEENLQSKKQKEMLSEFSNNDLINHVKQVEDKIKSLADIIERKEEKKNSSLKHAKLDFFSKIKSIFK